MQLIKEQTQQNNSRRDFLKLASIAALGMTLPLDQSFALATSAKKLRVGIVGGRFGCSFQFHEHPNCIVEAVSDLRPERREKLMNTYKCSKSYNSLEELVKNKEIDAVPAIWGSISARNFYKEGKFGDIFYCESEYQHDGLEELYFENGLRTWRYGVAPMHYPTHCTAHLISVTGERLTQVSCNGWGDDDPILKDNIYSNPFGSDSMIINSTKKLGQDDAGFVRTEAKRMKYDQPEWWKTELLPEPLRHNSGHHGSHTFITHEFVEACLNERRPTVDIHEALAYTVPGVIAHESALKGGTSFEIPQFD